MAQRAGKTHKCYDCGAEVAKAITNSGSIYIASVVVWEGDQGGKREILPSHKCDEREKENWSALRALNIARGALVQGQEVITVKGRKVPKGTVGIIFWVEIDNGFAYGDKKVTRVGFKDAQGTAHFTAATNVVATNQIQEAK